jgi:hypothetical protein
LIALNRPGAEIEFVDDSECNQGGDWVCTENHPDAQQKEAKEED